MPGMERPVFHVYPDGADWVVRRGDARTGAGVRFRTRDAAMLRARELADECRPSRIEVQTHKGMVGLDYDV